MNANPQQRGITKYWRDGEDDRRLLLEELQLGFGGKYVTRGHVDAFLDALWSVVSSRPRTKFVGFGIFEWRPWKGRLPTGRRAKSLRLVFTPSRYARRYKC